MAEDKRIKRTYVVTREIDRKLAEMARKARRDKSAHLCVLIEQAYRERVQAQPTE